MRWLGTFRVRLIVWWPWRSHFAFLDRETKIHLLLEFVHTRDLHGELVAEPDHPARAAAHEIAPRFVEHIKVILDRGQRHEAAHREAGHVHEEAEVPHVG